MIKGYEVETNGVKRKFEGKDFDGEFRIYRVYGDVSDLMELAEAVDQLAIEHGFNLVTLKL